MNSSVLKAWPQEQLELTGSLLEMQTLGSHPRGNESETLGMELSNTSASKSSGGFYRTLI